MSEFKIEKDIPVPQRKISSAYPIDKLEVGDSFAVPRIQQIALNSRAAYWKKKNPGWDYKIRTGGDEVRLWRIG